MFDRLLKTFSPRDKKAIEKPPRRFNFLRSQKTASIKRSDSTTPAPVTNHDDDDDHIAESSPSRRLSVDSPRYDDDGGLYPKGDSPLIDALRSRSVSSPPPRTSIVPKPTLHLSVPAERQGVRQKKKTVRWGSPINIPSKSPVQEEESWEEGETLLSMPTDGSSALSEKEEVERASMVKIAANQGRRLQAPRLERSSSIPIPTRHVSGVSSSSKPIDLSARALERPLPFVHPEDVPAPLRIPSRKTYSSCMQSRSDRYEPATIASSSKTQSASGAANLPCSEKISDVVATSLRPTSTHLRASSRKLSATIAPSQPTSFLKVAPRRPGTTAHPVTTKTEHVVKPIVSLAKSSTTPSFKHVEVESSSSANFNRGTRIPVPTSKPDVVSGTAAAGGAPKPSRIPLSSTTTSFATAKDFWTKIDKNSSPVAGVGAGATSRSSHRDLATCKSSKVTELSSYTVNPRPAHLMLPSVSNAANPSNAPNQNAGAECSTCVTPKSQQPRLDINVDMSSSPFILTPASMCMPPSISTPASMCLPPSMCMPPSTSRNSHFHSRQRHSCGPRIKLTSLSVSENDKADACMSPIESMMWDDLKKLCVLDASTPRAGRYCGCDQCVLRRR
ncbi:hypothetical protein B0T20DRAFT_351151 [Sordaria brevicollis]|uniref:Uncharacterized protein n=1 Tax=Sordaria brevicollis TaxID=83679 RepID=A0AAE0UCW2_SORBR|nr:hypothetical protein B0T20DRAFT_351151 [Sordaria brevicollis]